MASIFRRIYDWLLRLFWCVLPLTLSISLPLLSLHHRGPLGMRHLLPPMSTFLATKQEQKT